MKLLINSLMISLLIFVLGCTENVKKADTNVVMNNPAIPKSDTYSFEGCRQMIIGKDTAYIALQESGDSLYGPLEYKRFEKDSNKGKVRLIKKAGRAEGWYNFKSEGMNSVRQIIFEIKGDSLAEAYGDIVMKGDTAMFKYPHALQFEEKHSFVKTNCK